MRALALILLLAVTPLPAVAADLLPFHARYRLTLVKVTAESLVVSAAGDLLHHLDETCDSWVSRKEMRLALRYRDGEELRLGTALAAEESKDGLHYSFELLRLSTTGREGAAQGEATLRPDGSGGSVRYSHPAGLELVLPPGTRFPVAHTALLLDEGAGDEPLRVTTVFDGSERGNLFEISASIVESLGPETPPSQASPLLTGVPSLRVVLAYFEAGDATGLPKHLANVRIYANGVVDEQVIDFGAFVLAATLESLEPQPRPDC